MTGTRLVGLADDYFSTGSRLLESSDEFMGTLRE